MIGDTLLLAALVGLAGAGGGLLAGLLGVGGGIVIVPALELALGFAGVPPDLRMHLAVGTSLASIIPTALASSRAHRARGALDRDFARRWALPIGLGAAAGAVAATLASGAMLRLVFAAVAVAVGLAMLRREAAPVVAPARTGSRLVPASIGLVSAMMGIGGGTLSVPMLARAGLPIHRAVGTSAWLGLWIALPAAAGFVLLGWGREGLPPLSAGFVSLAGLVVLAPASVLAAPLGARLAHRLSRRALRRLFGLFLLLAAGRMLWQALAL